MDILSRLLTLTLRETVDEIPGWAAVNALRLI
jgi:hypothetical protein